MGQLTVYSLLGDMGGSHCGSHGWGTSSSRVGSSSRRSSTIDST